LGDQRLASTPPGSAIFLSKSKILQLKVKTATLIGIENAECFLKFEKCLSHFPDLAQLDVVLVWRWSWGIAWQRWMRRFEGSVLYFPDYDPAGLAIFATQVLPHRPDARLLLPKNLDALLSKGKRQLYLKQEFLLRTLPWHPDIDAVAKHLRLLRKALEQESLIC
jgi:hypothetical protein